MKVVLVNGSPHKEGCTYTALQEIAGTLEKEGIDSEIFWIGNKPLGGCISCGACDKLHKCVFDDTVNSFREKAYEADGFVFGSPVHYAAISGNMKGFLDRFFRSEGSNQNRAFYMKPAAAVVSARRGGTTAAFDEMNKYFTISEMPIVSSCYWNMVHGYTPADVKQDLEGLYIMRNIARNMAYLLKCQEAAAKAGVSMPVKEERIMTNFIRSGEL